MINFIQNKKRLTWFGEHRGYFTHGLIKYNDGSYYNKVIEMSEGCSICYWDKSITYDYCEFETMFNLKVEYNKESGFIDLYEFRL